MVQSPDGSCLADKIIRGWPGRSLPAPVDQWYAVSRRHRRRVLRVLACELSGFLWFFIVLLSFRFLGPIGANAAGVGAGLSVGAAYLRWAKSSWNGTTGNSLFTPSRLKQDPEDLAPELEAALSRSRFEAVDRGTGSVSHG